MTVATTLAAKRDGGTLDADTLREFIAAVVDRRASDAQLGAFAMAVCLRGMQHDECLALTAAMRDSGRVLRWPRGELHGPLLDKHSTGGVGDLVSLLLAPMLAAVGAHVPMISGRGLGHTGGTLDKLESIAGYDCHPPLARFQRVVVEHGLAIVGAGAELAPADARLYAVRDLTATVESIPLIVASILSKKLAAGVDALVLDVKHGDGALLAAHDHAEQLAAELVAVAGALGLPCDALLTDMAQPLADCAGNAIEVRAALGCLRGERSLPDALAVSIALGTRLLQRAGLAAHPQEAEARLRAALASGAAAERFAAMVHALGGPADLLDRPSRLLPWAPIVRAVDAAWSGRVTRIDTRMLGGVVLGLGGGRLQAGQAIDHAVGLSDVARLGDTVGSERPLALIHARSEADWQRAVEQLHAAFTLEVDGLAMRADEHPRPASTH